LPLITRIGVIPLAGSHAQAASDHGTRASQTQHQHHSTKGHIYIHIYIYTRTHAPRACMSGGRQSETPLCTLSLGVVSTSSRVPTMARTCRGGRETREALAACVCVCMRVCAGGCLLQWTPNTPEASTLRPCLCHRLSRPCCCTPSLRRSSPSFPPSRAIRNASPHTHTYTHHSPSTFTTLCLPQPSPTFGLWGSMCRASVPRNTTAPPLTLSYWLSDRPASSACSSQRQPGSRQANVRSTGQGGGCAERCVFQRLEGVLKGTASNQFPACW
jgi:hypothetical protein